MPELRRFRGIVITMYAKEYPPPHFHARAGEHVASFSFDGALPEGSLRGVSAASCKKVGPPPPCRAGSLLGQGEPSRGSRNDRSAAMKLRKRTQSRLVDVTSVEVLHDHVVRLGFSDGCVGELDLGPDLWGPLVEPMAADYAEFCKVAVNPEIGTIAWPTGADLAPETLHADAQGTCSHGT